ncbi:MAG TPA: hypothetical protein PKA42_01440 [Candidatus Paceibacterota bacterium]|mgnify:CR=1 FL=1|nr:hypothetical protein [Candidatus Paceibacterota bacterium]
MKLALFRPAHLLLIVLLGTFSYAHFSYAALPCGDIIGLEVTTSIINCNDPFESLSGQPFELFVGGVEVQAGETVFVPAELTNNYAVVISNFWAGVNERFFLHDGDNYREIDTNYLEMTDDDIHFYASEYFSDPEEALLYAEALISGEWNEDDPLWNWSTFFSFGDYTEAQFNAGRPPLPFGTYTLTVERMMVCVVDGRGFWQRLRELIIPTAHACFSDGVYSFTFTLAEAQPEPTGASSILFLPGIQASRLYTDGFLGFEDQLWEPNINSDLEALAMDENGVSVNDVYTRDVLDEINVLPLFQTNIYKGFLKMLNDLKEDEQIKDFLPFAYDWRYSVDDIVISGTKYETEIKGVIDEIERLASNSYTDKVTIIGHSNGGLLAKAIMVELEGLGKTNLVDKVILVGSPQLGTPKAIGALLHGLDQQAGGGIITDDHTAREVMKNMAGAYGLLPSEKYFELVEGVIISQDDSESTAYLDIYEDVDSYENLLNFLKGNHLGGLINIPSALNKNMIDKAAALHDSIDAWLAPENVDVFEIAGVGIPTIKGFEYREFSCTPYLESLGCVSGTYSKPYPLFTTYGDETVVAESALAYGGTKVRAEVNLFEEGIGLFNKRYTHADLTESNTIQEYLDAIIKFRYQNETLEIPQDFINVATVFKIIGVHSPVNIVVFDSEGRKVGLDEDTNFNEVPGGYVFTLAGSKYVIVPEGEYEVEVSGYASSTFSLTVDELIGGTQSVELFLQDLPTNTNSQAKFTIGDEFSDISIDIDGDGELDIIVNSDTGIRTYLNTNEEIIVENHSSNSSSGTRVLNRVTLTGLVAGATISINDQEYMNLLKQLLDVIQKYLNLIKNNS